MGLLGGGVQTSGRRLVPPVAPPERQQGMGTPHLSEIAAENRSEDSEGKPQSPLGPMEKAKNRVARISGKKKKELFKYGTNES